MDYNFIREKKAIQVKLSVYMIKHISTFYLEVSIWLMDVIYQKGINSFAAML